MPGNLHPPASARIGYFAQSASPPQVAGGCGDIADANSRRRLHSWRMIDLQPTASTGPARPLPPDSAARAMIVERLRLTPLRAARAIAVATLLVTLASGVAIRLVDAREFPTIGRGLWWAAQTVTTVGYGDVVPHATAGRVLAVFVMLNAIAVLTVVTAAITASLLERASGGIPRRLDSQLAAIDHRLARLEEALRETRES
jgi:voltage-gated potassium channel